MLGAIDDIIYHIKRISPVVRMLMLGAIGFATASLLYGSRGPNAGALQFVLFGLVGLVPPCCRHGWRTDMPTRRRRRIRHNVLPK